MAKLLSFMKVRLFLALFFLLKWLLRQSFRLHQILSIT